MEYKFTFADGSEAIAHHGIKGMKWGVWNEETRKRYEGFGEIEGAPGGGGLFIEEDNEAEEEENPDLWKKKDIIWDADSDMNAVNIYRDLGLRDIMKTAQEDEANGVFRFLLSEYEGSGYSGYMINCATCSLIYDLRRRGYDVDANGTANMSTEMNEKGLDQYYVGKMKPTKCGYVEDAIKDMDKMPDGARGAFWGITQNGGGHAIAWEKENGKVVFRDCQSNKKYSSKNIDKLFLVNKKNSNKHFFDSNSVEYVRLDDKTPNLKRFREDGLVSSNKNNASETAKDKIKSSIGKDNRTIRDRKASIRQYDKMIQDAKERNANQSFTKDYEDTRDELKEDLKKATERKKKNQEILRRMQ